LEATSVFGSVSSLACAGLSISSSSTTRFREEERWEVLGFSPTCSPAVKAISYKRGSKFELMKASNFSNSEIRKDVAVITLSPPGQELALFGPLTGTSLTGLGSEAFLSESEDAPAPDLPLSDFEIL